MTIWILVVHDHTTGSLGYIVNTGVVTRVAKLTNSSLRVILITVQINTLASVGLIQIHPRHALQTRPIPIHLQTIPILNNLLHAVHHLHIVHSYGHCIVVRVALQTLVAAIDFFAR